jgi:feruloyl esterase
MHHCNGGPEPNAFNPLRPVIDWVETGVEPDQIIATHYQDDDPNTGVVTRTMPLCPYPEVAVFTGGDVNEASNWVCKRHANHRFLGGDDE